MTAVFLLPLVALAVVRYLRGARRRGVAWRLGVLFGLQFWLSTELCSPRPSRSALALVLAFGSCPAARPRLRGAGKPLLGAAGSPRRRRAARSTTRRPASSRARSTSRPSSTVTS